MENQPLKLDIKLFEIRVSALRRNLFILSSIFMVVFLAFIALGLLRPMGGREIYLVSAILVAIAFSLISALIKYEVAKSIMEFARMLSA
ncbi:MAG: hypothetical protein PVI78_10465 [Anaerolineales bacterium]|jgi:hypothetical protein